MAGVELHDQVRGPVPRDLRELRDSYWRFLERLLLGLVRYRDGTIYGLGIPLIRVGSPQFRDGAWRWPVEGGLLAAEPGGELGFGSEDGRLIGFLRGFHPLLPEPVYDLTQRPFHRFITRLFLLHLRGRRQPPGVPAEPALRLAAAAIDAGVLVAARRLLPRRRRPLWLGLVAAAYCAGSWARGGQTLGDRACGLRVVAADGSPVTLGQALLRLALAPAVLITRRALHDEVAGTEVMQAYSERTA